MVAMNNTQNDHIENDRSHDNNSIKLAMKDMQKSRDKLQRAQLLAGIGSFEYLPEDKMIILSGEACACLGLASDQTVLEIQDFCKDIRDGQYNQFCDMLVNLSDGVDDTSHFVFKGGDKTDRYIEVIIDAPSGTIEGSVSGVFRNVTKIKEAEIARNDTAQAFETVFYNAKTAIVVVNLKGNIIDFNESAVGMLGYSAQELKQLHSVHLLHEEDIMVASKIFAKFINSAGKVNSVDYRVKNKDGESIDVLVNFEMVIGHEGEKIFIFLNDIRSIKDMERKHLDQERMLIQQSKMATLGEMVALIAHQWQQPLNSIAMIVQMLDELIEVDEENRNMLEKSIESVLGQVTFMSNTMDDFRNFLKPSNTKCDFFIDKMMQDVVRLYRPQLRHYDINCEIFYQCESIKQSKVHGYENELKNVILNFLTNSRDAIEANGVKNGDVNIVLEEDDGKIIICIEDNGGGMPDNIMNNIFDPYVSSKGDKGTGLGLYMAKLIIKDRMDGDINLANTDRGLRICVSLNKVE